jgi:hypothetical protein
MLLSVSKATNSSTHIHMTVILPPTTTISSSRRRRSTLSISPITDMEDDSKAPPAPPSSTTNVEPLAIALEASIKPKFDIKVHNDTRSSQDILSQYKLKKGKRRTTKEERRSSIFKSLAILDIDENDEDYKPENNYETSNNNTNTRRYLRRGGVTEHKMKAEVQGMQPTQIKSITNIEEDNANAQQSQSDYVSDYYVGT